MPTVVELESLMTRFLGDNSDLIKKLSQIDDKLISTSKNLNNTANAGHKMFGQMTSSFTNFSSSVQSTTTSLLGLEGGLLGVSQKAVKLYADMQALRVTFEVLTGDVKVADKTLKDLYKFAQDTPFEVPEVVQAAKQMLAFGDEADQLVGTMRKLGDVSSGLEIPLGQLVYLYGTLKAQGQAMTVDIRQFAMRGIPIYLELGKVLKLVDKDAKNLTASARARIDKLIEEGRISFDTVEEAFNNMTKAGGKFAGIMDRQSKELKGMFSNMKDEINATLRSLGENIAKELRLKELMQNISAVAKELNNLDPETKRVVVNVLAIGAAITAAVGTLIAFKGVLIGTGLALGTATTAATALAVAVMAVNTAALAAGGALVYYGAGFDKVNEQIERGGKLAEDRGRIIAERFAKELEQSKEIRTDAERRNDLANKEIEAQKSLKNLMRQRDELIKKAEPALKGGVNVGPFSIFNPQQFELEEIERDLRSVNSAIKATKDGANDLKKALDNIGRKESEGIGNPKEFTDLTKKIRLETLELGKNATEKLLLKAKTDGLNQSQLDTLAILLAVRDKRKDETDAIEKNKKEGESLLNTIDGLNNSLKEELYTLSNVNDEHKVGALRARALELGVGKEAEALLSLVEINGKLVNIEKEHNKLREEAKKVLEDIKTPLQRFADQQLLLNRLLDRGLITFDDFQVAMSQADKKLQEATGAAKAFEQALRGVDAALSNTAEAKARVNAYYEMIKAQKELTKVYPVTAPAPRRFFSPAPMPRIQGQDLIPDRLDEHFPEFNRRFRELAPMPRMRNEIPEMRDRVLPQASPIPQVKLETEVTSLLTRIAVAVEAEARKQGIQVEPVDMDRQ